MSLFRHNHKYRKPYGDGILSNNISYYTVTKYTNNTLTTEFNYRLVTPAEAIGSIWVIYICALTQIGFNQSSNSKAIKH